MMRDSNVSFGVRITHAFRVFNDVNNVVGHKSVEEAIIINAIKV